MASWIIVSSRCVLGLSTGSRPASAMITIMKATRARTRCGVASQAGCASDLVMMAGRLEERAGTERARIATSRAGSARAPIVMARLAPMPPNAVPVSRPPSARKTEPRRRRKTTANKSADQPNAGSVASSGAMMTITRVLATRTTGARGKTQLACSGRVRSRRASLRRSSKGCRIGGPIRPSIRQRTLRMSPSRSGPQSTTRITCSNEMAVMEMGDQPLLTPAPPGR